MAEGTCEHLSRYKFALQYAKGRSVLDAGCGSGYGAHFLKLEGASMVYGIDISARAIGYARQNFLAEGLDFECTDLTKTLNLKDRYFDVIISFEIIEHIKDTAAYLSNLARLLKGDGYCIFSTPNRDINSPGWSIPHNSYHVKEYNASEFQDLLNGYFSTSVLFGQYPSRRIIDLRKRKLGLRKMAYDGKLAHIYQSIAPILPNRLRRNLVDVAGAIYLMFKKPSSAGLGEKLDFSDFLFIEDDFKDAEHLLAICRI
ncbi:MAG: class I SAM-dependent methyltransferase [Candidatus Omnitrophica bacterium]|nr:class I SAM-dependent methyltransferase [Candidatus Omnitrophota bacterium]